MNRPDRPTRLFRALLRLYPASYRTRYGEEMEAFFQREREAGGRGVAFWPKLLLDHIEAAWAVRARLRPDREEGRMSRLLEDARAAARSLRRAPRFAAFAIGTLALGVGATTAVFTVVERVVVRPLPYPASERLALVGIDVRMDPGSLGPISPAMLRALELRPGPAEEVGAARGREVVLLAGSDPERVTVTEVSAALLPLFGAEVVAGRGLQPQDHEPGAAPVVVLGHDAWVARYGADPTVVGAALTFDDRSHTVVGVLSPDFVTPPEVAESDDFWLPLRVDPEIRSSFFLAGIVRMRPGATLVELDAHADEVLSSVYAEGRPNFLLGSTVRDYHGAVVGPVSEDLGRVLAAVTLLLLIACVNVASLFLTRGARRMHELGVHFALGAPRGRLVRKLLVESTLVAGLGGVLGAVLAWAAAELFRARAPAGLPRLSEVALDGPGLAFALVVATGTSLLFGLAPALRCTARAGSGLGSRRGASSGRAEGRIRSALVSLETALAVVLAIGSALLAHDLARVASEDPGFRPAGLVAMTLDLEPRYGREEWAEAWGRLIEAAAGTPGVRSVAVATQAPWDGTRMVSTYRPEGWEGDEAVFATTVAVGGDYLGALGTSLVAGRAFEPGDGDGEPVVIVNEALVERYWPGTSGVGKLVESGEADEPTYRVIGVIADVRTEPGSPVGPHVFHALAEAPWREMEILVRADGDAAALAPALRGVVRDFDPSLPVTSITTLEAIGARELAPQRFYATLFSGFAVVALLLAVVGVYGTTAYATRSRLREAGIRRVLGARSQQVVRALVTRSGAAILVGAALGLGAAALGSTALADSLRYVEPRDWPTYSVVGVVVLLTGLVAAWLPAAEAGRGDPVNTLREE